jgi:MFS family permease
VLGAAATVVSSLPVFFTAAMAVQLTAELGFGAVGIGAAVGTYFGTMALSSVHLGRVADQLGATRSLRLATLASAAAAFEIAVLATNLLTLAIGLAISGLAAALAQPAANRLLIIRVRGDRLGAAFGLKQSAPPAATMLAGLAVPAIALTVGWRWAYALAGLIALFVAAAVGPPPPRTPGRVERHDRSKPDALAHRPMLILLAISFGLAFSASSVVLAFYVDSAVQAGTSQRYAGLVFAGASLTAIVTRLVAGVACDRFAFAPLRLCAALLATGALGLVLLATGDPAVITLGAVVALAGTWGFPGVFWYALVRAYPDHARTHHGHDGPRGVGRRDRAGAVRCGRHERQLRDGVGPDERRRRVRCGRHAVRITPAVGEPRGRQLTRFPSLLGV